MPQKQAFIISMVKVNIVCSYRKPSRVCPKKVTNILDSKEMYTKILQ